MSVEDSHFSKTNFNFGSNEQRKNGKERKKEFVIGGSGAPRGREVEKEFSSVRGLQAVEWRVNRGRKGGPRGRWAALLLG